MANLTLIQVPASPLAHDLVDARVQACFVVVPVDDRADVEVAVARVAEPLAQVAPLHRLRRFEDIHLRCSAAIIDQPSPLRLPSHV